MMRNYCRITSRGHRFLLAHVLDTCCMRTRKRNEMKESINYHEK